MRSLALFIYLQIAPGYGKIFTSGGQESVLAMTNYK